VAEVPAPPPAGDVRALKRLVTCVDDEALILKGKDQQIEELESIQGALFKDHSADQQVLLSYMLGNSVACAVTGAPPGTGKSRTMDTIMVLENLKLISRQKGHARKTRSKFLGTLSVDLTKSGDLKVADKDNAKENEEMRERLCTASVIRHKWAFGAPTNELVCNTVLRLMRQLQKVNPSQHKSPPTPKEL
jgi:hypothetical protein